jgi:hypothetical protein
MKKITVNVGRADAQFDIEKVEAKYKAKFVGQLCLKTRDGGWANSPADVYYQETVPVEGYSKYFALIYQHGSPYITSGASAVAPLISAVVADDGEVIYSRYRHDYRTSADGSVTIDGGRDYTKGSMHGKYISLKIVDGEFYELENGDLDMPKDEQEHITTIT